MALDPLGSAPEFRHERERHITEEVNSELEVRAKTEVTDSMVRDLFSQVDSLLGKTDVLAAEIERTANPFIPAHAAADEVRMALRGLYPDQPDDVISFVQYMSSLEYLERQVEFDPVKFGDLMTGNRTVDSRLLSTTMVAAANEDLSAEELAVIGGQFLILAVCNRMLQTFQAPNTQAAVVGKMPPATELASTLMQFLIGLAAVMLQTAVNEDEVSSVMQESFGDAMDAMQISSKDLIARAKAQEPDDLLKKYNHSREEEYQAGIRDYSTDYVLDSTEPGYEPWIAAQEVRSIRNDLSASQNEATNYVNTVGEIATAPYTMSREIYRMMICRNMDSNKRLDELGAVLSSKYTKDLVCCFVRFAGAIPTRTLEQMRLMLQIAANGFAADIGAAFRVVVDGMSTHLERKVLEPILHMIDNFFRRISDELGALFDPAQYENSQDLETLLICTPVEEVMAYILSALEKLKAFVIKYVRRYWDRIGLKSRHGSAVVIVLADSKRARILLRLLDSVISSLKHGNLCAEGDETGPSAEDLDDIVDHLTSGLPPSVQLEVDGVNPYSTFSSRTMNELKTSQGFDVLRPIDKEAERGLSDCARNRISDATIATIGNKSKQLAKRLSNGSN